jgi:NarL family two-component system response regulator LiaR
MNNDQKTRVLIVEDHGVVRSGLQRLLEDLPDIQVIGAVERAEEALRIVEEQAPDVVLLDLVLDTSQMTGLDTLKRITATSPTTRVVVLSAYSDDEHVFPALTHGAIGYILKRALPEEVIEAVREAARGRYRVDALLMKKIVERLSCDYARASSPEELTERERQLIPLLARGLTNAEIARECGISPATVKTHVSNILQKLGVSARDEIPFKLAQKNAKPPS